MPKKPQRARNGNNCGVRTGSHGRKGERRQYHGVYGRKQGRPKSTLPRDTELRVPFSQDQLAALDSMRAPGESRTAVVRRKMMIAWRSEQKRLRRLGMVAEVIDLTEHRIPRDFMLDLLTICPLEWAPERMILEVLRRGMDSILQDNNIRKRPLAAANRAWYDQAAAVRTNTSADLGVER